MRVDEGRPLWSGAGLDGCRLGLFRTELVVSIGLL